MKIGSFSVQLQLPAGVFAWDYRSLISICISKNHKCFLLIETQRNEQRMSMRTGIGGAHEDCIPSAAPGGGKHLRNLNSSQWGGRNNRTQIQKKLHLINSSLHPAALFFSEAFDSRPVKKWKNRKIPIDFCGRNFWDLIRPGERFMKTATIHKIRILRVS